MHDRQDPARTGRQQLAGVEAIGAALAAGESVRLVLVEQPIRDAGVASLVERARVAGVPVRELAPRAMQRLARSASPGGGEWRALALLGPDPVCDLPGLMGRTGVVWLVAGVRYPGNAGAAIRSAEVSGAAGIVIDSPCDRVARREAARAAIRADRFIPVLWEETSACVAAARAAGRAIVAIEHGGLRAPWEVDLARPCLLMLGGEERGLPPAALEQAHERLTLPAHGFIGSYNLQAAMAMVIGEVLRQSG